MYAVTITITMAVGAGAAAAHQENAQVAALPTPPNADTTGQPSQSPPSAARLVPQLVMPDGVDDNHPLRDVIQKMWAGKFGKQPLWRLSLLLKGLKHEPATAKATAYSSYCCGGGTLTRWGTEPRPGICAADPRYWGPGSVIWMDGPVDSILIVEDTGGAIKGKHRFDVCLGDDIAACYRFGVRKVRYVPLYRAPRHRRWGTKPADWTPPAPPIKLVMKPKPAAPRKLASRDPQHRQDPG